MNHTLEDICQNEIDPDLYLKRLRELRCRKLEEIVGGIGFVALIGLTFAVAQIAYGIW